MPSTNTGSYNGKVVLVTGASVGLGLAIATAFAEAGANVILAARGAEKLEQAASALRTRGLNASGIVADITQQAAVEQLINEIITRFGRLDVVVNNAGSSQRRAVLDTTAEDFQLMMELNLIGTVRVTRAAAPHLLASRGSLVNISSLAGKAAARYMGAYSAAKFAVTAYTHQLRLELSDQGLHVLLVCPGPIERDEPRTERAIADRAEDLAKLPESARRPGGGVKTKRIGPEWLAGQIVRACEQRRAELIVPWTARILFTLMQLSPRLADFLVKKLTG